MFKLKSLNKKGFGHVEIIIFAVVVLAIGGIGYFALNSSSARKVMWRSFMTVDTVSVNAVIGRDNPNYILMTNDHSGYTTGLNYGVGFTITNKTAGAFQIKYNEPTQGQGFYESSGGLQPNQVIKIHTYINPNKPNGIYQGSMVLQYYNSGIWHKGPTINYTIRLVDSAKYLEYIDVQPLSADVTLDKADAATNGLIYGQGIVITAKQNTSFQFKYNEPTQGQGFDTSSGGLVAGRTATIRTYINRIKPNGTYAGSAILQYVDSNKIWQDGPTINYTINLTDTRVVPL